ncbi:MAG TPA: glycosyltransferase family 2 protein [Bryobacteraceae bacterium]|nr:glycosyltransferase family 2 protein [Bryobacteraceae bacterium]
MTVLETTGALCGLLTVPGTIELLFLTTGAVLPRKREARGSSDQPFRLAVVVPAHNEESSIARCVRSLRDADLNGVELTIVVIADNCTDRTAAEAMLAGARVLERTDAQRRGKGYALDYAFKILLPEWHDAFAVVDADSEVSRNFCAETAARFRAGADATQCRYVVRNAAASVRTRLMNTALLAFNVLRPRGRDRLGLSAGIYGNGFALSARTLGAVPYTADSVVEDLEYHIALVRAGRRVRFVDGAAVYGDMPEAGAGVRTQRARWEGGRFRMMAEKTPFLLKEILRGKWRLIEPSLDLLLLPLAFHVVLLLIAAATPATGVRTLGFAGLGIVALHLAAAIWTGGGRLRDFGVLAAAPFYIVWKILLLPRVLATSRSGAAWVRTERAKEKLP